MPNLRDNQLVAFNKHVIYDNTSSSDIVAPRRVRKHNPVGTKKPVTYVNPFSPVIEAAPVVVKQVKKHLLGVSKKLRNLPGVTAPETKSVVTNITKTTKIPRVVYEDSYVNQLGKEVDPSKVKEDDKGNCYLVIPATFPKTPFENPTKEKYEPVKKVTTPKTVEEVVTTTEPVVTTTVVPGKPLGVYTMSKKGKSALSNVGAFKSVKIMSTRSAPTSVSHRINLKSKPQFSSSSKGVVVYHKELISQLISSSVVSAFSCTGLTLNPGKSGTFPWLSTIAGNFDKYVFRNLKFHLVSNQPTTVGGRIGLSYDFDSTDPVPADRNEFFTTTYHSECAPWDSVTLNVPLDRKERFVNSHTVTDSKLIDCGQVMLMSDTIASPLQSAALADVIVEYVVELIDPQQAVFSTMFSYGKNINDFSLLSVVGPVVAQQIATTSATSVEFSVPQGYYLVTSAAYDASAGSPTLGQTVNGGVGFYIGAAGTAGQTTTCVYKITTNTGKIKMVLGAVTLPNIENISFSFTRISATVYAAGPLSGQAVGTY